MTRDQQQTAVEAGTKTGNSDPLAKAGKRGTRNKGEHGGVGCPAADEAAAAEEIDSAIFALGFAVHVSLRYHARRRGWFDALHRLSMTLSAVGGSAALAAVLASGAAPGERSATAIVAALAVTVSGALSVAFGFSERARLANDLYRRFSALAQAMAAHSGPGAAELRKWKAERLLIEADEPPIISTLNVLCHNAEAKARGYGEDQRYRVHWWQRAVSNLLTLPPTDWRALA